MAESGPLFLGIDVGTQGARVLLADRAGAVVASAADPFGPLAVGAKAHEQNPERWWSAVLDGVGRVVADVDPGRVDALCVTATSGTLVVADESLRPLRPALMWNDKRAAAEAREAARALADPAMRPGFTVAKALWVRHHEPEVWARARWVLSAGDWLLARITGQAPVTDPTNALKLGVDLETLTWPTALEGLGVGLDRLPRVTATGTDLGAIGDAFAQATGLGSGTRVVLGATDATAAQIAAGAVAEGSWVTTIGTGLSIKTVTSRRLSDPSGALYSHRHWDGGWIVSGTSHCGGDSLATRFPDGDWDALTAARTTPSSVLVLPLSTVGEYFPFRDAAATGFEVGDPDDRADLFRGYLEGVAHVERLAVERIGELTGDLPGSVAGPQATMGGGARNDTWMRIRASVIGRPTTRTLTPTSALGAAVLAAAPTLGGVTAAASAMVRVAATFDPEARRAAHADDTHERFRGELSRRGYLQEALS